MKLTIGEIARQADVSKGTVSRVINGHSTVAAPTRERVMAVMKRLGYEPDPVARELSMRTKHTFGIWVGAGTNRLSPYFSQVWRALLREMQNRGTKFVDMPTDIHGFHRRLDAVLMFDTEDMEHRLALLAERHTPVVLIGHHPEVSCVGPDDLGGGRIAANSLLALGHHRILLLGASEAFQWAREREAGFTARLAEAHLKPMVARGGASVLGGYRLMHQVWARGERPTGVFCATDEMAIGALGALEDLGVSVPGEVSVLGFDGLTELHPGLASVGQDIPAIAHTAVSLALGAIEKHTVRHKVVPVTLIPGHSLGPAPKPERGAESRTGAR